MVNPSIADPLTSSPAPSAVFSVPMGFRRCEVQTLAVTAYAAQDQPRSDLMFRQKRQQLPDVSSLQRLILGTDGCHFCQRIAGATLDLGLVRVGDDLQRISDLSKVIGLERGRFWRKCILDCLLEVRIVLPFDNKVRMKLPADDDVVLDI